MREVTLVYFEGCPEAKNIRAALLSAGVFDFNVVIQDKLEKSNPYKKFSSPSVLIDQKLVYGVEIDENATSCTFTFSKPGNFENLIKKFQGFKTNEIQSKKSVAPFLGTGMTLLLLKCPACIPGVVAFLSALGLGFLLTPSLLKSVFIAFLLLPLGSLVFSCMKYHRNYLPLLLGGVSALILYIGRFYPVSGIGQQILTYSSVIGLVVASVWDLRIRPRRVCSKCD